MDYTDIAIIGGGLAGSTAAAMLGRAGIPTVLIDPHRVYPFDFRVEKISGDEQVGRFCETGIADSVLRSATHDGENWIPRFRLPARQEAEPPIRHHVRRADRRDQGRNPAPWLREMRQHPVQTMNAARRITGDYAVAGDVKIRPPDLYVSTGYRRAGVVLVGDAFAATCPVTGRHRQGVHRRRAALQRYIPAWLATEGMGEDKIASYYDDPVKQACDAWSMGKAVSFRKVTIENGLSWRAQRWARFLAGFGEGALRRMRSRISAGSHRPAHPSSSLSSSA